MTVKEAGRKPPPFPFIFFKPITTIVGHEEAVVIPKIAQDDQADYEGELCIVIGRDAKNVSTEDALSYVAAFTAGNDVSSRKLQRDPAFAGGVPQWGFSKGFDTFAPLGPVLVRPDVVGDPKKLLLKTIIDGEVRQEEFIDDLLFDCAYLISYLSSGTTLQKGSVIMTGTPGGKTVMPCLTFLRLIVVLGVGAGFKPPKWLVPGTKMEVNISGIGTLRNYVVFAGK
jgi:2-keto-4-pentenoate hydratase/2-oxohepta-3-ene-1,7-dioic acid hydratase in catechol pathway